MDQNQEDEERRNPGKRYRGFASRYGVDWTHMQLHNTVAPSFRQSVVILQEGVRETAERSGWRRWIHMMVPAG